LKVARFFLWSFFYGIINFSIHFYLFYWFIISQGGINTFRKFYDNQYSFNISKYYFPVSIEITRCLSPWGCRNKKLYLDYIIYNRDLDALCIHDLCIYRVYEKYRNLLISRKIHILEKNVSYKVIGFYKAYYMTILLRPYIMMI